MPIFKDAIIRLILRASLALSASLLLFICYFLFIESAPALSSLGLSRFLSDKTWHPLEEQFALVPMVAGTLLSTLLALLIALPLGFGQAVYLRFFAPPWMRTFQLRLLELLAGIPSVVFGFWGLVRVVPLLAKIQAPGTTLLCAGLVLALMILPTLALGTYAAINSVDEDALRAADALCLSRTGTLFKLVVPMARSGIQTATILAVARALGETMAVLMVAGNVAAVPDSIFAPVRTLTANIALEMSYAMELHRSTLFVSGLFVVVLVVTVLALNALFQSLLHARTQKRKAA